MPSIARECPKCKKYSQAPVDNLAPLQCPLCQNSWAKSVEVEKVFDRCPVCECRQFYTQKDFNQALGCAVMAVGIVLVPWTYGLSLPVFALIDWVLHKRVSNMVVCYKCHAEFRGFPFVPEHFKNFMHHIGVKYDK